MLINVKAKGVIKWILSFVESKKQLNILIYNKVLRERLELNTQLYKDISYKYIVKDKNGIVKIYHKIDNSLLYEGGFIIIKRMEKERNLKIIQSYLKENLKMEKEMGKEKNIMKKVN